jgi:SAM-dependent methyltransferase
VTSSPEERKAAEAEAWSSAPWEQADWMLASVHLHLVDRLEPQRGERWLDLATGTGAVARLAARAGADVTGVDFAAGSIETARRLAAEKGLEARFEVGDVEHLSYADASFDVLSSSMGMIFAPDHAAVAGEVARVCRPGGRLGFTAWKEGTGFSPVADRYRPPDPDAGERYAWADRDHVRGLLGDTFELRFEDVPHRFPAQQADEMWSLLHESVGPFRALAASLEPDEVEAYRRDFLQYVTGFGDEGVPGDYLLVLGTRR